ncbi:MAG: hypothetical protein J6D54_00935 [Olsenella sp.]|nr:hypothetical protein [Olsenella sp.]
MNSVSSKAPLSTCSAQSIYSILPQSTLIRHVSRIENL